MFSGRHSELFGLAGHGVQVGSPERGGQRQAGPDGAEPRVPAKALTFIPEQPEAQAASWLPATGELQGWAWARPKVFSKPPLTHILLPFGFRKPVGESLKYTAVSKAQSFIHS